MEDPVRLAEADASQDHGLGLEVASHEPIYDLAVAGRQCATTGRLTRLRARKRS